MYTKHSTSSIIGKLFLWNSRGKRNRGIKIHQKLLSVSFAVYYKFIALMAKKTKKKKFTKKQLFLIGQDFASSNLIFQL
jgi:lipopolysaccharide biosynthesis regulator YciM